MTGQRPCCAPTMGGHEPRVARPFGVGGSPDVGSRTHGMVRVPSGSFWMGSEADDVVVGDGEGPERRIFTAAFYIDVVAVTNANFATFVKATGYVTQAEQLGWSFVFDRLITPREDRKSVV